MLIHCVFVEILLAQSCSSKWLILFEKHATANSSANGNKWVGISVAPGRMEQDIDDNEKNPHLTPNNSWCTNPTNPTKIADSFN
jgi:hypothetical protein